MPEELHLALRWIHFVAGITWIGLLYWFNLVNGPFNRVLDPTARPMVVPVLLPRALAWFRHSAWVTVVAGLVLIYFLHWQDGFLNTNSDRTITTGGLLGIIMAVNVWVFIWPNQRRVINAVRGGQPPDPAWARTALFASRANFTISFPMLLFMAGASHAPMDWPAIVIVGILLAALGFAVVMSVQKWAATRF